MTKPVFPAPQPVSLEDGRKAVEALRALGRVDIDAFLSKLDVTKMLEEPVGPTAQCLTLNQLEEYAFSDRVIELPHLAECESCANALRAYRAVKERAATEADPRGISLPEVLGFGVEVPETIDLVPALSKFDVMLQVKDRLDMQPADLEVANGAFSDIECQTIDMVESGPESGWTYRARCVARRDDAAVRSFEPGATFVDWIRVSGKNKAGQKFGGRELARFSVSPTTVRSEVK